MWISVNDDVLILVISLCLFKLFMGFSRQECWSGLPFPFPVYHVLSELSTMTHPFWVALHGVPHSFNELDKAMIHVISLVSFLWLWFSFFALWWIRGLWKLPDGRNWLWRKLSLVLVGKAMLSFCSVAQSCLTLFDPMNRSMPGLPVHHQFPEFTQTHVHQVSDAIQPSHPLSSPSPPAPNPSQHQGLLQWVYSSHEVAKVLEFQL